MSPVLNESNRYAEQFAELEESSAIPQWLESLRSGAMARFNHIGFPTRKDEEWRYTNPAPIAGTDFELAPVVTIPSVNPGRNVGGARLVFVNGHFAPPLSDVESIPSGVTVGRLSVAIHADLPIVEAHLGRYAESVDRAFVALNTAFLREGAFVHIPRGVVVEAPIQLVHISEGGLNPTVSYPRTLIIAEENSQATIVEEYSGTGTYLTNAVTEVVVGASALVDHYKLQQESPSAFHVATMQVNLERAATFSSHSIGLGSALARSDANAAMAGEYAECTLNGLYLVDGRRLIDNHTFIDHAVPNCNSHEVYKGILGDHGRGVFNGKILVRLDAQKTDAKQTNKTVLLSPDAQINAKPQLEIFADDVKCTHGATIGQLDAEALFYLRTRGLREEDARALLIYAFASDIISRIKVDAMRERIDALLLETLPAR